jgi:tRNA(fMet)-specific endonuclease VapC
MVIMDTDHISLPEREGVGPGSRLQDRLYQVPENEVTVTIVSFEEQTRGWFAHMARARTLPQQIEGYRRLRQHLQSYRNAIILDFDETAAVVFQRLRSQRIRIGTFDPKIAAIAISRDATLLSRNLIDFRKVPGLKVEDWTT